MPLNLTPKALAEVNKHRPTAIECVAAALAKAEELARLNPESDVYRQEREAARNEMLSLLSSK